MPQCKSQGLEFGGGSAIESCETLGEDAIFLTQILPLRDTVGLDTPKVTSSHESW